MGEATKISWCDHTFNPWIGCMKVGPACDGCYAENLMDTRLGRVSWGAPREGVGTRSRTSRGYWHQPKRWNAKAEQQISDETAPPPPFVFGGSLCDPFDNAVASHWRSDYFELIRQTPKLVWLLLTKRPQNIIDMSEEAGGLPSNVAIGTTAENQFRWEMNIGELVNAKAVLGALFAFASVEPLLGPLDPRKAEITPSMKRHFLWSACGREFFDPIHPRQDRRFRLDWIITGGETDQGEHKARPANPQWFRDIRDACLDTGTVYHHKQNGEWASVSEVEGEGEHYSFKDLRTVRKVGKKAAGRLLDGVEHNDRPEVRV